ncbi:MAG: hydantoinase B/oxoprolinase family protein [Candidatus Bipolaricaulota bacterium]
MSRRGLDAAGLEVLRHGLAAVAEEMNADLIRTAYSPNVNERRDCSSAVLDASGRLVAQAESIPVHLGAMPFSVASACAAVRRWSPGDIAVMNDPYAGGAHLPDITFVAPVFVGHMLVAFVANRAHHADVGGKEPGSVAADCVEIFQEGLRIPPVKLWRCGRPDHDLLSLILLNVRTPEERRGDLEAQSAGCRVGVERVAALAARHGRDRLVDGMQAVLNYAERRMRDALSAIPKGKYAFEDALEDDGAGRGPLPIRVAVTSGGDTLEVDFTGSAPQTAGPLNAVPAVTASAVYFAVLAATDPTIPPNEGAFRPIQIHAPLGTILNPRPPAAVVGGNLETSQRIVDVLLGALGAARPAHAVAASQGTMNNVTFGGCDPRTARVYTFYETVAGGFGARPDQDGIDGVHAHMTNTLNTPIEALEKVYPLRVRRYELVAGSGGAGRWRGGLGIRREVEAVGHAARVSILSERRLSTAYGVAGGSPGRSGRNAVRRADGTMEDVPSKGVFTLEPGDALCVETPGGGGYGEPTERAPEDTERDRREGKL